MTLTQLKISSTDIHYCVMASPFGHLGISTEMVEGSLMLSGIHYLPFETSLKAPGNELAKEVIRQCKPVGTSHQQKVWGSILEIPLGLTRTYGELAHLIRSGPRAVGTACGANPYPLIVPCHRVVSAQGIGGFMKENSPGFYRQIKIWLLKHEGIL